MQKSNIKIMDALRAWGVFSVFRSPLFVVVGCWLLVFLHFFHYTPPDTSPQEKRRYNGHGVNRRPGHYFFFSGCYFCFDSQLV
jgi:hypothetical protein